MFMVGLGLITFFIGLGLILNGLLFTVPKKRLSDKSTDAQNQRELDVAEVETNELSLPESKNVFTSVTEPTTRHLEEKHPVRRS